MSNVQVKPLEWEDWSAQHRTNITAMTQFGRYGVIQLHFPEMHYKIEPPVGKPLSALTLEAAKAAAQADYEARIRSALVPAPALTRTAARADAAEAENKRLREALQDIMADRPSEKHNGNRNDLIAWQMWRRARAAITHPTGG